MAKKFRVKGNKGLQDIKNIADIVASINAEDGTMHIGGNGNITMEGFASTAGVDEYIHGVIEGGHYDFTDEYSNIQFNNIIKDCYENYNERIPDWALRRAGIRKGKLNAAKPDQIKMHGSPIPNIKKGSLLVDKDGNYFYSAYDVLKDSKGSYSLHVSGLNDRSINFKEILDDDIKQFSVVNQNLSKEELDALEYYSSYSKSAEKYIKKVGLGRKDLFEYQTFADESLKESMRKYIDNTSILADKDYFPFIKDNPMYNQIVELANKIDSITYEDVEKYANEQFFEGSSYKEKYLQEAKDFFDKDDLPIISSNMPEEELARRKEIARLNEKLNEEKELRRNAYYENNGDIWDSGPSRKKLNEVETIAKEKERADRIERYTDKSKEIIGRYKNKFERELDRSEKKEIVSEAIARAKYHKLYGSGSKAKEEPVVTEQLDTGTPDTSGLDDAVDNEKPNTKASSETIEEPKVETIPEATPETAQVPESEPVPETIPEPAEDPSDFKLESIVEEPETERKTRSLFNLFEEEEPKPEIKSTLEQLEDGSISQYFEMGDSSSVTVHTDANGNILSKSYGMQGEDNVKYGYTVKYDKDGNIAREGYLRDNKFTNVVEYDENLKPIGVSTEPDFNLEKARAVKEGADKAWKELDHDGIMDILPDIHYKHKKSKPEPKPEPESKPEQKPKPEPKTESKSKPEPKITGDPEEIFKTKAELYKNGKITKDEYREALYDFYNSKRKQKNAKPVAKRKSYSNQYDSPLATAPPKDSYELQMNKYDYYMDEYEKMKDFVDNYNPTGKDAEALAKDAKKNRRLLW